MWWNQHKKKILAGAAVVVLLAAAFWYGGDAPGMQGWTAAPTPPPTATAAAPEETGLPPAALAPSAAPEATPAATPEPTPAPTPQPLSSEPPEGGAVSPEPTLEATPEPAPETFRDKYLTGPVPEGRPAPVEPEDVTISDTEHTCTLSVRCDTILDHMDWLDADKAELVPEDGVIFPAAQVTFYEGESVFNVLQREMKRAAIHMEFANAPMYHSAYIEGIHNLYEMDCGELSGWMYQVNGWFPNYGCSRYVLQEGDVVEWVYTCDLGADVGASLTGTP